MKVNGLMQMEMDLDLAFVANRITNSAIFFNIDGVLSNYPGWSNETNDKQKMDWADIDNDGDLDVVLSGHGNGVVANVVIHYNSEYPMTLPPRLINTNPESGSFALSQEEEIELNIQ